jgi:hypothetical protein
MRIFEAGQVDEPDAIAHCSSEIRGCAQGESGLAHTAGPHQGEEAGIREHGFDFGEQSAPSDEAGRLRG